MSRHRITCIEKSDRYNAHERILSIGGINADDNSRWKISQQDAVRYIEDGTYEFYVYAGGSYVDVIVATSRYGNKYIKTTADGEQPDNLLSLDDCP